MSDIFQILVIALLKYPQIGPENFLVLHKGCLLKDLKLIFPFISSNFGKSALAF